VRGAGGGEAAGGGTTRRWVESVERSEEGLRARSERDLLVTEEPLEIRVRAAGEIVPVAVTMRTPGADFPLSAGFLFGEGLLDRPEEVASIRYCLREPGAAGADGNSVTVTLAAGVVFDAGLVKRNFFATSSCGVCGKASIEALESVVQGEVGPGPVVPAELLLALPDRLRERQRLFSRTGGLHAAGLFAADGEILSLHEDVGRHNAFDKMVGEAWLSGRTPLEDTIALVSGRVSFEVVQKAARAGIPILAGVSAPSSLAVALAERFGITLVGFLREGRFNLYTGRERLTGLPARTRRRG
jgi:FdhD protein